MKSGSFMGPPRRKIYRFYKNFDFECFNIFLKTRLDSIKSSTYNEFNEAFSSDLNKNVSLKFKMIRHNNDTFLIRLRI